MCSSCGWTSPGQRPALVVTDGGDLEAVFSRDGRFIAFEQTTDGRQEVYIQGYPSGPRMRVSVDGGRQPVWNPKGGELFFHSPQGVMAVGVRNGAPFATPALLVEEGPVGPVAGDQVWDVSPDGSRFLAAQTSRRECAGQRGHELVRGIEGEGAGEIASAKLAPAEFPAIAERSERFIRLG